MASEKRGWAADTKRVVMPQGTYPRMWKTSGKGAKTLKNPESGTMI